MHEKSHEAQVTKYDKFTWTHHIFNIFGYKVLEVACKIVERSRKPYISSSKQRNDTVSNQRFIKCMVFAKTYSNT